MGGDLLFESGLFDTHAHYDDKRFDEDREELLKELFDSGTVYGILNCVGGFAPPSQTKGYIAIVLMALVPTVLAFWSFFAGMERTGPSTAALVSTWEPVVTVLASVLILSEPITMNVILGGCLVIAAVVVSALPQKTEEPQTK